MKDDNKFDYASFGIGLIVGIIAAGLVALYFFNIVLNTL
jgi:hypothetical protein